MSTLSRFLAAAALMASAVIYGTDVFCAIVQRPALAQVSDRALTSVMGRVHEYGDRRLPLPGALGITAAAIAGHAAAAVAAATAVTAQAMWLIIYVRASAPVNRALTQPPWPDTSRPTPAPSSRGGIPLSRPAPSCRQRPPPRCAPRSLSPRGSPTYPYRPVATEAISRRPAAASPDQLGRRRLLAYRFSRSSPEDRRAPGGQIDETRGGTGSLPVL